MKAQTFFMLTERLTARLPLRYWIVGMVGLLPGHEDAKSRLMRVGHQSTTSHEQTRSTTNNTPALSCALVWGAWSVCISSVPIL